MKVLQKAPMDHAYYKTMEASRRLLCSKKTWGLPAELIARVLSFLSQIIDRPLFFLATFRFFLPSKVDLARSFY